MSNLSIIHVQYGFGDGRSIGVIIRGIPERIDGLETENLDVVMCLK